MSNHTTIEPLEAKIEAFLEEHQNKPKSETDITHFLSALDAVTFDRNRTQIAKGLEIRTGTLDSLFKKSRPPEEGSMSGSGLIFPDIELWEDPVDGADLLDEIHDLLKRHVILQDHGYVTTTLWIVFSWAFDLFDVCPILFLTSPEKRCGKTTLLGLLSKLTARPLPASNISPSAVFRVIERIHPTLLIDEADSFLRENEELRGIVNSGHTRAAAFVIRTVGEDFEPRTFSTWGPKVLAGIGKLADTLEDRSIRLDLKRKTKAEKVSRITRQTDEECREIVRKIVRWVQDHQEAFRATSPSLPEIANDRAFDNWYPLSVIATVAGGRWPEKVKEAVLELEGRDGVENSPLSIELLGSIKGIFEAEGEKVSSAIILERLNADEEGPWKGFNHGRGIDARTLSKMLKPFGIRSKPLRDRVSVFKGFERTDFEDAFCRYLPQQISSFSREGVSSGYNGYIKDASHSPEKNHRLQSNSVTDENSPQTPNRSQCNPVTEEKKDVLKPRDLFDEYEREAVRTIEDVKRYEETEKEERAWRRRQDARDLAKARELIRKSRLSVSK